MSSDLLEVHTALERILSHFAPLMGEVVSLAQADGRVLMAEVRAPISVPPFDNSSMDGFALQAADISAASPQTPVTLQVIADIPAGSAPQCVLQPGQAARIMTGAVLPQGADAVVPVEMTNRGHKPSGNDPLPPQVQVFQPVERGAYVRRAGEDVRAGDVVLSPRRLRPQDIGFLAMLGIAQVMVRRTPRLALFSTGDELLPPGEALAPGKIYDANTYSLQHLIRRFGADPFLVARLPDRLDAVEEALQSAVSAGADLIVSTAGVSMGVYDFMRVALERQGTLHLWRVNMRPGKPLTFGHYLDVPFLGLPGNPVSAFVSAQVFLRPIVARLLGLEHASHMQTVTLGEAVHSDGRQSYLRVTLQPEAPLPVAHLAGHQGSGNLYGMTQSDALLIVPAGVTELPAGAPAQALLLD
ncbi:MAG: molybdopterin molybdotransferase MoeA [Anaerolineales bacterium]